ncbi:hypothetical protein HHK36_028256 [Tetracentron sinense]|uniref:MYB-CC type transcription factor LHEQLE-containing domain-containing protein n=1 Tax=Tetracentron sinense TaxID=13715 RepID=A0A834YEJ7_TETSI|nr:hypothetical protein HHK36_028256 [Tetracentron sinense]
MERTFESYQHETGVVLSRDPKPRLRWTPDLHDRFVDAVTKLGGPERISDGHSHMHSSITSTSASRMNSEGKFPNAEALMYQIEVQRRLHEQLEVQKKLQMRIEAQGKYLQTILDNAQKSLSFHMNCEMNCAGSLEATRAQLIDFNLALSGLMENVTQVNEGEMKKEEITGKSILHRVHNKSHGSAFQLYQVGEEETKKEVKLKVDGGSPYFDLNAKGSCEFLTSKGSELETKMPTHRR